MIRTVALKPKNLQRTCLTCTSGDGALCTPLDERDVATVQTYKSSVLHVDAGEHLYWQHDEPGALFGIVDGWVMLYETTEDGRRQILDFVLSGEFVSFQPVTGVAVPHAAQALTSVTACVFLQEAFERLLRDHPRLATGMIWLSARCEARAYDHLCNVSQRPARARLIHLLLELYFRMSMKLPATPGDSLDLPLTQQHVADALGLSLEHVNRTLRELREAGLIEWRNGSVVFSDPAACVVEGGLDPAAFLPSTFTTNRLGGQKAPP